MDLRTVTELSPYGGTVHFNADASNADLVRYVMQTARAAWPFIEWPKGIPRRDAARAIHELARRRVRYVREDGDQLIRFPWRALEDGQGDCKTLSVFVASMARAAGLPVRIRFVRYLGDDHFAHVYAVVDGIPVDPELSYGEEVTFESKMDRSL